MDEKLQRIRELIDTKEKVDGELNQLLGITEKARLGRPRKTEQANGHRPAEASEPQGEA
jgi:hypothetical protein